MWPKKFIKWLENQDIFSAMVIICLVGSTIGMIISMMIEFLIKLIMG